MGGLSGHPNIENILHVGVTQSSRPYIVMPYHVAGSLAERLHRVGRIGWPDALRTGVKLCGALETAHRAGSLPADRGVRRGVLEAGRRPADTREHLAAVSDGVYVYTVGGRFLSSDRNSAAFERFDPQSGEWVKLVDMPTPRGSFGAAYIDGRIVAVGGEEPTRVLATAEMYDIAETKWITLQPIPTPRHAAAVVAVGSAVYCIGGADRPTHEGPVPTIEALDFT